MLLLSTVESTYSNGRPFDPLKSLCHPAVFNTAITRARSLVIAVGNPFTLTKSEEMLGSTFGCWKEFISRCKKNGTYNGRRFRDFSHRSATYDGIVISLIVWYFTDHVLFFNADLSIQRSRTGRNRVCATNSASYIY